MASLTINPTEELGVNRPHLEERVFPEACLARSYVFSKEDQPFHQQLTQALEGLNISQRKTLDEVHTFLLGHLNPTGHRTPVRDHAERKFQRFCHPSGAADPGSLQDAKNFVERVVSDQDIYGSNIIGQNLEWACEPYAWAGASITTMASFCFRQETCERKTTWLGVLWFPHAGHDWHVKAFRIFTKATSTCHRTTVHEINNNRLEIEFEARSYVLPQIR